MDGNEEIKALIAERKRTAPVLPLDLDLHVFEKFYLAAKERGIVWTLLDLAKRDGLFSGPDEDFCADSIPEYREHGQAIEHVMQMEVACFVFSRMNGPWGEVVDGMLGNRNRFSNEYRERTGYQIDTEQDELLR